MFVVNWPLTTVQLSHAPPPGVPQLVLPKTVKGTAKVPSPGTVTCNSIKTEAPQTKLLVVRIWNGVKPNITPPAGMGG